MSNLIKRIAVVFLLAFSVSACALTEDIVELKYDPMENAKSIGADSKSFNLTVVDERGEYKGRIGAKVNGFGAEMADIKSSVPVREVLFNAIRTEMEARKLDISEEAASNIDIIITALHNNFQVGVFSGTARGITAFTVGVKNTAGDMLYEGAVSEVHLYDGIQLASGENAGIAIEGALKKAVAALFNDPKFVAALVSA